MTYRELASVFGRIGILSFGGPAAQIALMHKELVEDRPWLTEDQFLRALSLCMLLPGPEAMQLATYAGWRMRGIAGGLIAGGLFVLPGALIVGLLAALYVTYGTMPLVQAAFLGVKATVVVIVLQAILRLSRKALQGPADLTIAALGFVALFAFDLPFPLVIAAAALWGALSAPSGSTALRPAFDARASGRVLVIGVVVWALPVAAAALAGQELLVQIGLFFSRLAVVTFGGAYAVLAYMTQEVVTKHGWLTTPEMIDALGLAETTPGPLILVTQFVGQLAGAKAGGAMLATLGALMTLWVTFVPCFVWIFALAPLIDWLEHQPRIAAALRAITAAVVGVIANLSVWFAVHLLFAKVSEAGPGPLRILQPSLDSFQPLALGLVTLAAALLLWRRWHLAPTLAALAAAGFLAGVITAA